MPMNNASKNIVVAITGASGSIYAKMLLDKLESIRSSLDNLSIVFSPHGKQVWLHELNSIDTQCYTASYYKYQDFNAPFASGSSVYDTLIVVPCSMGSLAKIANGISDNLITRCADVMLKEKRRLILVVRDTPYNYIHIKNMEQITLSGGIIFPASPSFYSLPKTIEQIVSTVIDRVIDMCQLPLHHVYRWGNT